MCVCLQVTVNRMGVRKAVSAALLPVLQPESEGLLWTAFVIQ